MFSATNGAGGSVYARCTLPFFCSFFKKSCSFVWKVEKMCFIFAVY